MGGDRDQAQSSFLKPLKGCTFLPCKKHEEEDISRKIAHLSLPYIKQEIHDYIFGSEHKKEKGIIDSESAEEFMVKVKSVSTKWEKLETEILGKQPQFSKYFQRYIPIKMACGGAFAHQTGLTHGAFEQSFLDPGRGI